MTVLIITHSQDNESIPLVMQAIASEGGKAFRFDTDRFPTQLQLNVYYGKQKEQLIIIDEDNKLDLSEVSAVWYRRIAIAARIPNTMDSQLRQASVQESRVTIQGMIASIPVFHLDRLPNIRHADNKQLQLQVARMLGLDTPRTLITNNPQAVKEFSLECDQGMIAKMLSSFAIYDREGQEHVVFTNPVTDADLDNLDGLDLCPMTFQEKVPKALELRTTIVGKRVFTAAVDSQSLQLSRYDWRKQGIALLNAWQPYDLPQDVENKLLELMAHFGLNYGAIDIILTPDGRHIFLEINPVGEFFWMEHCPGFGISQAIAEVLLTGSHRMRSPHVDPKETKLQLNANLSQVAAGKTSSRLLAIDN